ncbi:MAG: dockerin type I domain-containing protein [Phycisphaerales bacterium JB063]
MNPHEPHEPDTLPPGLIDALRGSDAGPIAPSSEHDDALLAGAREHLAGIAIQQRERRGRSRYVLAFIGAGGVVAAAAAVTFAVWINTGTSPAGLAPLASNEADTPDHRQPTDAGPADAAAQQAESTDTQAPGANAAARPGTQARPTALTGDLDHSGTLDILDAFALARAIKNDGPAARSRDSDFNHDGKVDQQDADWLADRAVSLRRDGGRG